MKNGWSCNKRLIMRQWSSHHFTEPHAVDAAQYLFDVWHGVLLARDRTIGGKHVDADAHSAILLWLVCELIEPTGRLVAYLADVPGLVSRPHRCLY